MSADQGHHLVTLPNPNEAGHHDLAVLVGRTVAAIVMPPRDAEEQWLARIYDHRALHLPPDPWVGANSLERIEEFFRENWRRPHHD